MTTPLSAPGVSRGSAGMLALIGLLCMAGCQAQHTAPSERANQTATATGSSAVGSGGGVDPKAQSAQPGLEVGTQAPDAMVTSVDGRAVHLAALYKDGPVVLTFYRGGWCPICTRTLAAWGPRLEELKAAGGTFVALTPEKPDLAVKTREKAHADYAVFSDGDLAAAKAFKVHFVVDDQTKAKYQQFGLRVAESNVSGTWELPAPATFVIDRGGIIRWQFADWDYKKRADPDEVIRAVRNLTKRE